LVILVVGFLAGLLFALGGFIYGQVVDWRERSPKGQQRYLVAQAIAQVEAIRRQDEYRNSCAQDALERAYTNTDKAIRRIMRG
jgi:hypothetical protein